jgi:hypothetical protein
MGLAERQRLLARLATDAGLRARLAADVAETLGALGLSPDDAAWLAALPSGQVDDFADSLIAKRRGEVAKLLPGTARALGAARFVDLFRHHASRPIPDGPRKHRDDAIAFAASLRRKPLEPPWLADLSRLEASALMAHDPARPRTICLLAHHPKDLARAVATGTPPGGRPTLVAWFRLTRGGRPRRVIFTRPW